MSARLFKRGDIWFAWVPRAGGGTRKVSTQCTDKKAAERRAAELEREALDPSHAAANKATTAAACAEFLGSRARRGRAEGTLHHYRVKLGHVVRLMPQRLTDVDGASCERFIEVRLEEGAAQTTVKKELRALGATLRHAKRRGEYMHDIESVIPELEDTYEPRERFLHPLELVALVNALPKERAARVVFIVATGARWGESDRACHEDIDGHMVRLRGTKTKLAAGTVPVPPTMRVALSWALDHADSGAYLPTVSLATGREQRLLFAPWSNVRRDLAKACAAIGIAPVTPNDLRRTFATWLRMSGVSTDLIGAALRHSTSRMAELVYGRIEPADLDRLITERGPALIMSEQKESKVLGLLMGGDPVDLSPPGGTPETATSQESPCFSSARSRNRTSDTGIFNPLETAVNADESDDPPSTWAANGLTFRARARRWLTRVAA